MNRLLRSVLALVLTFVSATAFAGETAVQARAVTYSCQYYSAQEVEVGLSYRNYDLPWGTSVYLVYGWGGTVSSGGVSTPIAWDNTTTVTAPATAAYTWGTTVRGQITYRSSPKYYKHIDFVWKVVLPNGSEFYEKGNDSSFGYYAGDFSGIARPCTTSGGYTTTPEALTVTSVVKW